LPLLERLGVPVVEEVEEVAFERVRRVPTCPTCCEAGYCELEYCIDCMVPGVVYVVGEAAACTGKMPEDVVLVREWPSDES
jgi:hypothetical protein